MKSNKYKIITLIFAFCSYYSNAQQLQQKDSLKNTKTENFQ